MVHLATLLSTAVIATSLIPSVVLAVPIQSSASEEGLVEREPSLPSHVGHKRELIARFESEELLERNPEPFFGFIKLAAKGISAISSLRNRRKRDLSGFTSEELELISRAEPEDLDALMARNPEPFFGFIKLAAKGISALSSLRNRRKRDLSGFTSEELELIGRAEPEDLAELMARNPEPFFGFIKLAAKGISAISSLRNRRKRDLSGFTSEELELMSRAEPEELAALMARNPEPFLQFLSLASRELSSKNAFERNVDQLEDLEMREAEDFEEFEMREYDEDEVIAREWAELDDLE
ncbi:hypothetical protein BKA70DRAFT_1567997 [Coprinopsis sp. MPI-PUGE-AT-0042]|nr:hypothetical protein BKA70DRAFT_1567997 [Coprinopsis sp. MPI-PUGE-AT-0042]